MYAIADHLRARGVTVVLGGLHCTLVPEEAAAHADAVVVGEGELLWPRVLDDWKRGALQPAYRNGSFKDVDLAHAPLPRYDLLDVTRYNRTPIQTARGCHLDCEFCAASKIFGGYKRKPVANVARELREIKRQIPHPFVELADDNTFVDKRWSRELVRALDGGGCPLVHRDRHLPGRRSGACWTSWPGAGAGRSSSAWSRRE